MGTPADRNERKVDRALVLRQERLDGSGEDRRLRSTSPPGEPIDALEEVAVGEDRRPFDHVYTPIAA